MSIILNVVQEYMLQKACDLTCEAALTVLRIWSGPKLKEKGEPKNKPKVARKPVPVPAPVPLPGAKCSCLDVSASEIPRAFKYAERDVPRFNSGSIDPPQCSCMRVCRDSYFS